MIKQIHVLLIAITIVIINLSQPASSMTVTLAWDAVADGDLHSYTVHYGRMSRGTAVSPSEFRYMSRIEGVTGTFTEIPNLDSNSTYFFAVTALDSASNSSLFSNEASGVIAVEKGTPLLFYSGFSGVAPNPAQGSARFDYTVTNGSGPLPVTLKIFDSRGRLVRAIEAGPMAAGRHSITWDGRDQKNRPLASGRYIADLRVGEKRSIRTLQLTR